MSRRQSSNSSTSGRLARGRARRMPAVVALAVVTALALASCGDGGDNSDIDVIRVGQVAEPASLDPAVVTAVNDFRINVNVYDGLVQYDEGSLAPAPALATEWEISDDGTVYTFHLREGVTFHDGTAFDAEAVVFNFERMLDDNHPFAHTGPFPLAGQFYGIVEDIRAVGDLTVEFELASSFAPFLANLAYPTGLMVSPAAVEQHGEDFGRNPVGTGPYKFAEWVSNERVVLERNDDYWGGTPGADAISFVPVTEATQRVNGLRTGELDIILELPPGDVESLRADATFEVAEQAGPHVWFLILNALEPPFDDVRMRQAVNYALDRESIVNDVLQGTATVANGPIAEAFDWAYHTGLQGYAYDPDRARKLIEDAGYGDGVEVTFYVTEGGSGMLSPVAMGEAIQANLADVGITASIQTFEWNTFLNEVNAGIEGKADMAEMAWMTNDPDTLPFLTLRTEAWPDAGGFNSGYYSNPDVDRLLEAARAETDQAERARLYQEMQEIVVEDAPWAFVASWKQNAATAADITGFELHPSFLLRLHDVSRAS